MTRLDTNPRSPLEDRLRDSLQARATDVSASPELWHQIDEAIARRRRVTMLATAGGTALAVGAAAVVVPNLLDDGDRLPDVTVVPSPGESSNDTPPPAGQGAFPDPTHAVAISEGELQIIDVRNAQSVAGFPLEGDDQHAVAVRPRTPGDPLEVAYLAETPDGWEARVLTIEVDALDRPDGWGGVESQDEVRMSLGGPTDQGLPPGLAWSPDGAFLAWVLTVPGQSGGSASLLDVFDYEAAIQGRTLSLSDSTESRGGQFLLADGATAGRLTLKDWTWDAQYEDGRVGRVFLTGDGRSWEVEITHSGGVMSDGFLSPIDVADDFDQAGPEYGVYTLFADQQAGTFRVEPVDADASPRFSYQGALDGLDLSALDLAVANDHYAVSLGDQGVLLGESDSTGRVVGDGQAWGPVDFVTAPWVPADFVPGDEPVDQPTDATDDPTAAPGPGQAASLPGFIVTTDGEWIRLARSNGDQMQLLHLVEDGEILGMDVRPGSSTEDLLVVFSVREVDGGVSMWSVRGRADDQAGLATEVTRWQDEHQPSAGAFAELDGQITVPMFTGDGRYVAYVENTVDGATMRIFGWLDDADAPGTGGNSDTQRNPDDNVSFSRGPVPMSLERFSDEAPSRSGGPGYVAEFVSAQSTASACEYERQPDGGIAEIICEADRAVDRDIIDLTDTWLLENVEDGVRLVDMQLAFETETDGFVGGFPQELQFADPTTLWMTGREGHVFLGDGERTWLVTHEGNQLLPGGITWVAGIR